MSINQIRGAKEIAAQLSEMGKAAGGKALRNAAAAAGRVIVKAAKQNAPVGQWEYTDESDGRTIRPYPAKTYKGNPRSPGYTKRNVAYKTSISRDKTKAFVNIGVRSEAFYALQFLELGTSKFPKRPWLEPAMRQSKDEAGKVLMTKLRENIDKAARKK
jgi:HK97 gp10 family phage protein